MWSIYNQNFISERSNIVGKFRNSSWVDGGKDKVKELKTDIKHCAKSVNNKVRSKYIDITDIVKDFNHYRQLRKKDVGSSEEDRVGEDSTKVNDNLTQPSRTKTNPCDALNQSKENVYHDAYCGEKILDLYIHNHEELSMSVRIMLSEFLYIKDNNIDIFNMRFSPYEIYGIEINSNKTQSRLLQVDQLLLLYQLQYVCRYVYNEYKQNQLSLSSVRELNKKIAENGMFPYLINHVIDGNKLSIISDKELVRVYDVKMGENKLSIPRYLSIVSNSNKISDELINMKLIHSTLEKYSPMSISEAYLQTPNYPVLYNQMSKCILDDLNTLNDTNHRAVYKYSDLLNIYNECLNSRKDGSCETEAHKLQELRKHRSNNTGR